MLELFASQNVHFPVICIQETWLRDDSKIPLVSSEGYKCFHVKASASAHGGLITYFDDEFDVSVKRIITNSNIWEGQFLELNHEAFQNKIVIGNVYKPPRDNNNADNLNAFKAELEPILQELNSTNNEVLICGDYNINLLKLNGETHFSDFFDTMLGHSFYPKMTLPTRVNRSCGASLIDDVYCKLSSHTVKTSSGIILDELSDHYPYFVYVDNLASARVKPPRQAKQSINTVKAMENMLNDMKAVDIDKDLNKDLLADPNWELRHTAWGYESFQR